MIGLFVNSYSYSLFPVPCPLHPVPRTPYPVPILQFILKIRQFGKLNFLHRTARCIFASDLIQKCSNMKTIIHIAIQTAIIATLFFSGISEQALNNYGELMIPLEEPAKEIKELIHDVLPMDKDEMHIPIKEEASIARKLASWFSLIQENC